MVIKYRRSRGTRRGIANYLIFFYSAILRLRALPESKSSSEYYWRNIYLLEKTVLIKGLQIIIRTEFNQPYFLAEMEASHWME
jgi:hypothetical protein